MNHSIEVDDLGEVLAESMIVRLKDRGVTEEEAVSVHDAAMAAVLTSWPGLRDKCCEAILGLRRAGCEDQDLFAAVIQGFFRITGIAIADELFEKKISHRRN
jgi:hypothetical protein